MKDFYGKNFFGKLKKKKFRKNFHDFFSSKVFGFRLFLQQFFFSGGERSELWGGVGERSEPPARGLAVGAEGSVNSEFLIKMSAIHSHCFHFSCLFTFSDQQSAFYFTFIGQNSAVCLHFTQISAVCLRYKI